MAITFPPIMHPCYMGVDFPSREELLAHQVARDETDIEAIGAKVAASLGVDELHYNDIDGLAEAIGLPKDSLCFACINGDYSKLGSAKPRTRDKGLTDPLPTAAVVASADHRKEGDLQHRHPRLREGEQHARDHPTPSRAGAIKGAKVSVVISDKRDARALGHRTRSTGSRRSGLDPAAAATRTGYDERLARHRSRSRRVTPERGLVLLAGFMRLLSPAFVDAFRGRMMNVHPSLLPSFPGLRAQEQASSTG